MTELDLPALTDANKGLIICFIITILVSNFLLIFSTVRKGGFFYTPKSLIMISMAIGDVVLALFPMIVLARVLFEGADLALPCSTARAATVYVKFLIHFVYGFGLITLAVELVHRYKTQQKQKKTTNNIVKSLIYSAVPWFLGLLVVLPLTMAHIADAGPYIYQTSEAAILTPYLLMCFGGLTKSRVQSMYGVSVILPAPLAVLVCIVIMCIRLLPAYYTAPAAVTYQSPAQAVVVTSQNTNMSNATGVPQYPVSNAGAQPYPIAYTQGPQSYPGNGVSGTSQNPAEQANDKHDPNIANPVFASPATQYPVQPYPGQQILQYPPPPYSGQQYPPPQYSAQQYPAPPQYLPSQYPMQQYPPPQFPVQQYNAQSNMIVAAPAYVVQAHPPTGPALADPGKEKNALLVVSIVYFICVVPIAFYSMGMFESYYLYTEFDAILDSSFFWLSIFRSLITPLIFIRFTKCH